jgi:hypothetical protein
MASTLQTPTSIFKGIVGSKRFRVVKFTNDAANMYLKTGGGRTLFATLGGPTADTNLGIIRDHTTPETTADPGTAQGNVSATGVSSTVNYMNVIGN